MWGKTGVQNMHIVSTFAKIYVPFPSLCPLLRLIFLALSSILPRPLFLPTILTPYTDSHSSLPVPKLISRVQKNSNYMHIKQVGWYNNINATKSTGYGLLLNNDEFLLIPASNTRLGSKNGVQRNELNCDFKTTFDPAWRRHTQSGRSTMSHTTLLTVKTNLHIHVHGFNRSYNNHNADKFLYNDINRFIQRVK